MIYEQNIQRDPAAAREACKHSAVVLLVEDDLSVQRLAARLLEFHGFTVLMAASAEDSLAHWEKRRDEIDVLFTDVNLPGRMSGTELARHCQEENPHIKVAFTSGYEIGACEEESLNGLHFLQKPYRPEQLLELIRNALTESSHPSKSYAASPSC